MEKLSSSIKNLITSFVNKHPSQLVSFFFLFFLIAFFIDRILFSLFVNFPFFVVSAILVFPFLFLASQYKNPDKRQLFVLVFAFITLTILNSIVYVFGINNISDLLFVILFFTSYYYYKNNINYIKLSNVYVFLFLSVFLFSFTFFNIDSDSSSTSKVKYNSFYSKGVPSVKKVVSIIDTVHKNAETKKKTVYVDKYKPFKIRHTGLFRRTHMASYFFGFLFLFFAYQYQRNKGVLNALFLTVSLVFCFYTGIRTMPTAFVLSVLLFLFRRKYIIYLTMLLFALVILIIANEYFLQLTKNTIFYQYVYLIHTGTENFASLARFKLYQSWWVEVSGFGFWDFMIGKSYMNALISNSQNYGKGLWFHNDFLNIFYTYGIGGVMMYIWFFIKIYRDNKVMIRRNIFIFIFYVSMIIAAVINGFYYYFPVFLLYLFLLMIKNEKQIAG